MMRLVVREFPGVEIEGGALLPRPLDLAQWQKALIGPAPATSKMAVSDDGWPVELVAVGNDRFAFYAPLELVGYVVARDVPPEQCQTIEALLLSARVDLEGDEVIALSQLWE
jgi:hypothetical protein